MKHWVALAGIVSLAVLSGCTREKGEDVVTETNEKRHENRLINETSPYLLQHAHNPVDWYAWGEEALKAAREQGKPILVSIGYSACHWCHVMERESFEDQATADVLNKYFIAIKVDREERPDIDAIYMSAVQMMTGSGGWPLNVFLTPDLKPFFGGTYFPPDDRHGHRSFRGVLTSVARAWQEKREEITESANGLTKAIEERNTAGLGRAPIDGGAASNTVRMMTMMFDSTRGGFGAAPKFPHASQISLLLRHHVATGSSESLNMATRTLDGMAHGGIYDQLGGGFHRYSVDAEWLVPHFEKMLYDNALLAEAYLEAYQVTKRPLYARIARETLDYVLRDMVDKEGGFHAAEDADSEGEEGRFYVWSKQEIEGHLKGVQAQQFIKHYGVTSGGNFEGHNILYVPDDSAEDPRWGELAEARAKLLAVRSARIWPGRDHKVIAAWNGMMISALAKGYQVLGDDKYLAAAERAAVFIAESMTDGSILSRSYAGGKPSAQGFLDDYSNVANGYVALFEAGGGLRWLESARALGDAMIEQFGGDDAGGFYFTSGADDSVIVRRRDYTDGAIGSGNSIAALLLLRLGRLTGERRYSERADDVLAEAGGYMAQSPIGYMNVINVDYFAKSEVDVVIVGKAGSDDTAALLQAVNEQFLSGMTLVVADPGDKDYPRLKERVPLIEGRDMVDGKATAYVCINRACQVPITTAEQLAAQLVELSQGTTTGSAAP